MRTAIRPDDRLGGLAQARRPPPRGHGRSARQHPGSPPPPRQPSRRPRPGTTSSTTWPRKARTSAPGLAASAPTVVINPTTNTGSAPHARDCGPITTTCYRQGSPRPHRLMVINSTTNTDSAPHAGDCGPDHHDLQTPSTAQPPGLPIDRRSPATTPRETSDPNDLNQPRRTFWGELCSGTRD